MHTLFNCGFAYFFLLCGSILFFPCFWGWYCIIMGWNKENTIRTKDNINPQHYRTRVFFCVIKLYGSIWGWICIDSPYIALLLLFICFFFWKFSLVTSQNNLWTTWKCASHFLGNIKLYMTTLRMTKPKGLLPKLRML